MSGEKEKEEVRCQMETKEKRGQDGQTDE